MDAVGGVQPLTVAGLLQLPVLPRGASLCLQWCGSSFVPREEAGACDHLYRFLEQGLGRWEFKGLLV